ncbi:MAG: flavin reductase family protein [Promethearchaeota archaeon]
MKKLIFACMVSSISSSLKAALLAASIRKFADTLSDCPIWMLVPNSENKIPKGLKNQLLSWDVQIIPFNIDSDLLKFPFADLVLTAATTESLAKNKAEFLTWLIPDTIIIHEPTFFQLDKDKNLGYRPVHHTLIGSIYEKPIDSFWELIYRKCHVTEDKIFPMKTHVDHNTIRPYFNAGCLSVRPEKGILQSWWDVFKDLYRDPCFEEYYKKSNLFSIFIHQAVLAGVVLSRMEKQELQELPFSYNYPLHLYFESPKEYQPRNLNDLVTVRYENPQWLEKVPLQEPLRSWLISQLNSLSQKTSSYDNGKVNISKNSSKKVKFGKIPLIYPVPIILAGALVHGKPNFETLGDVGIMGINPPIVFISSGQDHYTNIGVLEHDTFSINFPPTKLLAKTDYCGTVSGHDFDKSQLFNVFFGELETAPMIRECPVNLECKVIKEFSIQHRQIFIGDVVQTYVNEEFVVEKEGRKRIADMTKLDPIIYALDNRYYKIGELIGVGYQESRKFDPNKLTPSSN